MIPTRLLSALLLLMLAACQSHTDLTQKTLFETHQRAAIANLESRLHNSLGISGFDPVNGALMASASESPATELSVDSADMLHTIALQHSPYIAAILIDLGIHEAAVVQRRLAQNPELALSLMRPEDGGRWQFEASLSLGLLDWLGRQRRLALADAEQLQWQMQATQLLGNEFHELRLLWLDARISKNKSQILADMLESANVSAEFSQLLFDAGNISELDLLANQSIADQRLAQSQQATLEADQALVRLKARLGLPEQHSLLLPDGLPEPIADTALSTEQTRQLLQSALHTYPALQLAQARQQQQEAALNLALRQQQLREAGIELITERENSGEREQGIGLSLGLPVFDSGNTRISQLQGEVLKAAQTHRQQLGVLQAGIETAVAQLNTSLEQLQDLESEQLPRLRQMMNLGVREYNFMLRGTFELLSIADLILDARLRQLHSHERYWQAVMQLEHFSGKPLTQALSGTDSSPLTQPSQNTRENTL